MKNNNLIFLIGIVCFGLIFFAKVSSADAAAYNWSRVHFDDESYSQYWQSVASNSDGSRVIAGVSGGRLYLSSDYGNSWVETRPAGDTEKWWQTVASSYDGSHLLASSSDQIYASADFGENWFVAAMPAGGDWIDSITLSGDASRILAAAADGYLYVSTDFGTNWSKTSAVKAYSANDQYWTSLGASQNGL